MLSSLKSHEEEETSCPLHHHHHRHHLHEGPQCSNLLIPSLSHARQLLINCAELIHHGDISAASRILSVLSTASSPSGDSTERLAYQFARAISFYIDRNQLSMEHFVPSSFSPAAAYLSLNEVTPYVRFAHLTANQAILEAVDGQRSIHVLDFEISDGLQWPPFLQDIADRSNPLEPLTIRITGTGSNIDVLRRTGERLSEFARSLRLNFEFKPLLLHINSCSSSSGSQETFCEKTTLLEIRQGETLAINLIHFLNKLLGETEGSPELITFLHSIKSLNPAVVTVAERESSVADDQSKSLPQRISEALDYYAAVFDSLEATLPPASKDRAAVEQEWLGREIAAVVSGVERHGRFEKWEAMMRKTGFVRRSLGPFALSQARMLLRLRYPADGYQIQVIREAFFLGWQNRPLFSISSWQ